MHPEIYVTPKDQTFNASPLICHRSTILKTFPLLRCSLSITANTTARPTRKYLLMNTVHIYQLLLPGDNEKILLPGVKQNEVLN